MEISLVTPTLDKNPHPVLYLIHHICILVFPVAPFTNMV